MLLLFRNGFRQFQNMTQWAAFLKSWKFFTMQVGGWLGWWVDEWSDGRIFFILHDFIPATKEQGKRTADLMTPLDNRFSILINAMPYLEMVRLFSLEFFHQLMTSWKVFPENSLIWLEEMRKRGDSRPERKGHENKDERKNPDLRQAKSDFFMSNMRCTFCKLLSIVY